MGRIQFAGGDPNVMANVFVGAGDDHFFGAEIYHSRAAADVDQLSGFFDEIVLEVVRFEFPAGFDQMCVFRLKEPNGKPFPRCGAFFLVRLDGRQGRRQIFFYRAVVDAGRREGGGGLNFAGRGFEDES